MFTVIDANDGADENGIKRYEEKFGISLPTDYREFLLKYNGGRPDPNTFLFENSQQGIVKYFYGIDRILDLTEETETYRSRMPIELVPIALDPGGNQLCIAVKGPKIGSIYYWKHEYEANLNAGEQPDYSNIHFIADSFNDFISDLVFGEPD